MEQFAIKIPKALQFTDDEFFAFCQENRDLKFERNAQGEILIMSPTGGATGSRNNKFLYILTGWNEMSGEPGIVFDSSTGFVLPNGAMRSPDASWVRIERWHALSPGQQEKFPPLCPDFVAELLSPSDSLPHAQEKMREWMANGCQLGWLLHPTDEKAWVYQAGAEVTEITGYHHTLKGGELLKGFEFDLGLIK